MKKIITSFVIAIILIPGISFAATSLTTSSFEEQRIQLMEQLIVLLKARLEILITLLGQQQIVATVTSSTTLTTVGTTTPLVVKKKSGGGGGGGGGSNSPVALVLDMAGAVNNFTITANKTIDAVTVRVTLVDFQTENATPTALTLLASTTDGLGTEIELTRVTNTLVYEADMRARLSPGVSFTGNFAVVFPDSTEDENIQYTVFYEGNGVTRTINLENPGLDLSYLDKIVVKSSIDNPDTTTLGLKDDAKSDWFTVLAWDLDTEDSVDDIILNHILANVTIATGTTGGTYNTLVDDAELVIDGVAIDDYELVNGTTAELDFNVNGDYVISAGDRVTVVLNLRFKALAPANEGATVVVSTDAAAYSAAGIVELSGAQLSGTAIGNTHTLLTSGVFVQSGGMSVNVTSVDGSLDDYATYSIEVDVTAFEQDVYLSTNPATSVSYLLENGGGVAAIEGIRSVNLTSTGDEVGSAFEVTEGSTETFTFTCIYEPGILSAARMQLVSFIFGSTSGTPTGQTWTASPSEDYRTSVVTIVN